MAATQRLREPREAHTRVRDPTGGGRAQPTHRGLRMHTSMGELVAPPPPRPPPPHTARSTVRLSGWTPLLRRGPLGPGDAPPALGLGAGGPPAPNDRRCALAQGPVYRHRSQWDRAARLQKLLPHQSPPKAAAQTLQVKDRGQCPQNFCSRKEAGGPQPGTAGPASCRPQPLHSCCRRPGLGAVSQVEQSTHPKPSSLRVGGLL